MRITRNKEKIQQLKAGKKLNYLLALIGKNAKYLAAFLFFNFYQKIANLNIDF